MKNIFLIVTTDRYPEGDAGAVREHAFACVLKNLGYTPIVIGMGDNTHFSRSDYNGVTYYSLRYASQSLPFRVLGRLLFKKHLKSIIRQLPLKELQGILFVSGGRKALFYIKALAAQHSIPLFYDCVEWFSPSEFAKGEKSRVYKYNDRTNREYIDKQFKVFSISSYLHKHFESRGISSLRVPVIMDIAKIDCTKKTQDSIIKIVYAGAMGTKDKIVRFIQALSFLDPKTLSKLKMYIIGTTREAYENTFGRLSNEAEKVVVFTGRIPRKDVLSHLQEADFTMLLRPEDERYAMAGFPTKVVESLASATPVITNLTSDLSLYLTDGENAIVVKGTSVEDCADALLRAANTPSAARRTMQEKARASAEMFFDYSKYYSEFQHFLNE